MLRLQRYSMRLIVMCSALCLFALSGCQQKEQELSSENVKEQMIQQWKEDFVQLKSMKLSAKSYQISSDGKEKHLFTYGSFVYDAPMFFDDVTLAQNARQKIDQNTNSKCAYDGKYFYKYSSGKALTHLRPKDHPESALIRAPKMNPSRPVITLNPLYYLFEFVLTNSDQTFNALRKPATWHDFENRMVDFKRTADGKYLFHCKGRIQPLDVWSEYEVTVASKGGIYFPESIIEKYPQRNIANEIKVLQYKEIGKSTFRLPFPLELSTKSTINGVSQGQAMTVVEKKTFQINQLVDKRVFTLHPRNDTDLIDEQILE